MGHRLRNVRRFWRSPTLWLLMLVAAVYGWLVVPYWKPTWDSATYISLARALVHGEGYTYMGYPHTKYPPGLPLLLAPIELFFGHQYLLMRLLIVVCAIGSIGVTYRLMRHIASVEVAWAVSLATAATYALVFEATRVLSDLPYMLVSLAALWAAERYRQHPNHRAIGITILLIVAAYAVRIIGFTLAPAVSLAILLDTPKLSRSQRIRTAALVLLVMGAVMALWMGRNALVTRHMPAELREALSYERELIVIDPNNPHSPTLGWADLKLRVRRNLAYYEQLLVNLLTAKRVQNTPFVAVLSVLWLVGWGIALFRRRGAMEYYTFFYGWVYLLWPSWQGERFLVPILPMIFYYALQPILLFFQGAAWIEREAVNSPRFRVLRERGGPWVVLGGRLTPISRWGVLALLALAVIQLNSSLVVPFIRAERQEPYYRGILGEYIQAIEWVRDHTPEDAVIITDRAPWAYLLSGRRSFSSPRVLNHQEVLDSMRRNGATHVIANTWGGSARYLLPVVRAYPEFFREIHRIGTNRIYEVSGLRSSGSPASQ